ncbi:CLUMA_CG012262, isoform A [Clunio marinus]|uniref:CLUMA_CG012262, isoform A n=1 Tax=Clunio marinus TaxID=568069 RepID=A0A1J1IF48_9DIPT|nr:CLUMA_CG012262, isoform A [Clunio marinus]
MASFNKAMKEREIEVNLGFQWFPISDNQHQLKLTCLYLKPCFLLSTFSCLVTRSHLTIPTRKIRFSFIILKKHETARNQIRGKYVSAHETPLNKENCHHSTFSERCLKWDFRAIDNKL